MDPLVPHAPCTLPGKHDPVIEQQPVGQDVTLQTQVWSANLTGGAGHARTAGACASRRATVGRGSAVGAGRAVRAARRRGGRHVANGTRAASVGTRHRVADADAPDANLPRPARETRPAGARSGKAPIRLGRIARRARRAIRAADPQGRRRRGAGRPRAAPVRARRGVADAYAPGALLAWSAGCRRTARAVPGRRAIVRRFGGAGDAPFSTEAARRKRTSVASRARAAAGRARGRTTAAGAEVASLTARAGLT